MALPVSLMLLWPLPRNITLDSVQLSLRITDRSGRLLYDARSAAGGLRQDMTSQEIPSASIRAVIAVEDRTFLEHRGVSVRGTVRAFIQNMSNGHIISGGSTITQQLVRSVMQPKNRTLLYKFCEAMTALKVERSMDKKAIIQRYLGTAYFGHQAYGLASAAQTYFGKSLQELSTAEQALLIGLLQSPSAYDPFSHLERARVRQRTVLASMRAVGNLTDAEVRELASEPIQLSQDTIHMLAPHFVQWLLTTRGEELRADQTVRTTLDLPLQQEIENIVRYQLANLEDKNVTSAAVVVLDAKTGDILSMVGSHDYFDRSHDGFVNRAIALRQPGSALKPFTYALALERGDTVATTVNDIESQFFTQSGNPYIPRNYDYGYHGLVRYREALANSYNIAAIRVLEKVGVDRLLTFLRSLGLTSLSQTPEYYGLALTLGDGEVRLLDLARAYAVFARAGQTLPLRSLMSDPIQKGERALRPETAWLISDILSDTDARLPEFGEAPSLTFHFPVAAKTGTTRNSRDNWTIGYTPDRIVGVWVGNADNSPMRGTSGITGAGPIFHDAMLAATRSLPPQSFPKPESIHTVVICRLSGLLPTPLCPHTIDDSFVVGSEPTKHDTIFQTKNIDVRNGLLAGPDCDTTFVRSLPVTVFPPELRTWARENGWQLAPERYSPACLGKQEPSESLVITRPHDGDSILLDPLIPDDREMIRFTAQAPTGIESVEWIVDGRTIGSASSPFFTLEWHPLVGRHSIQARSKGMQDTVQISVEQ